MATLNARRSLHQKWNSLQRALQKRKRILIAFSGGCDSAFLLAAARATLGKENILAVTAVSASLPAHEREATQRLAQSIDAPHQFLQTDEMANPAYVANPTNRCFFCKNELFETLSPLAIQHHMSLADGFNFSDRSDVRPGFRAAKDWAVIHPLDEANLEKRDIRILSRWFKLPTWNKPASPCLSSRVPYGTVITAGLLGQIEKAEAVLRAEDFSVVRVRHHGALARIEVPLQQLARLRETKRWRRICDQLNQIGFAQIEADPRGFISGRLNEEVK